MPYFPMFIELKDCPCLVVGGGSIASRKVAVLEDFGAKVTVIAPEISPEIRAMGTAICLEKEFDETDIKDWVLVVAATNDARLNRRVSKACRDRKIPVNAVDQIEDCSFIFPAYRKEGDVVAAFSSGGQSPSVAQYLKAYMAPAMTPLLGETAACLGRIRGMVKQCTATERERKEIYQAILRLALEEGRIPSEEEILQVISQSLALA
ncbi:MAG: bifunctional precorrin-2 dehydrogenase/sirohydrochlorin ferrochelatase [Lachnospiraceae bacterium]|nr:bifunctional precorrin-2 dehydrogenase/sirohydrochlorin ferrochelatase [Lachnospiraceae bacterium]